MKHKGNELFVFPRTELKLLHFDITSVNNKRHQRMKNSEIKTGSWVTGALIFTFRSQHCATLLNNSHKYGRTFCFTSFTFTSYPLNRLLS